MKLRGLLLALVVFVGCGGREDGQAVSPHSGVELPPPPAIGPGPRYKPPPAGAAAKAGRPLEGLRCRTATGDTYGAHLEIFANRRGVLVPAGIGVAPPRLRHGVYVRRGRCSYPVRTLEPTGLIEVEAGTKATLGDLFRLWGQRLSPTRVLSFPAGRGKRVTAYVDQRRWRGDPRDIPLERHAAIVLHVGGHVRLYGPFLFPRGL
jgi:hypothetical protein